MKPVLPDFAERKSAAINARKAQLDRFKELTRADDPARQARIAEREAIALARAEREAAKAAARAEAERLAAIEAARLAEEEALRKAAEEEAARLAAEEEARRKEEERLARKNDAIARMLEEMEERKQMKIAMRLAGKKVRA